MVSLSQLFSEGLFDSLLLLDIAYNQISDTAFSSICSAIMDNKATLALKELWIGGCPILSTGIIMVRVAHFHGIAAEPDGAVCGQWGRVIGVRRSVFDRGRWRVVFGQGHCGEV